MRGGEDREFGQPRRDRGAEAAIGAELLRELAEARRVQIAEERPAHLERAARAGRDRAHQRALLRRQLVLGDRGQADRPHFHGGLLWRFLGGLFLARACSCLGTSLGGLVAGGHRSSSGACLVECSNTYTLALATAMAAPRGRWRAADWIAMKEGDEDLKAPRPLCFVLMPFGRKTDAAGRITDFDAVYREIIAPAVNEAELEPIRADEEKIGGAIHKPMFERLMLCNYAVADITGANPNVYYELGIRHAMRPRSTVILFAAGTTLPFDIALLRGIPYQTNEQGVPSEPGRLRRGDREAVARGEGEPARRQPAVSAPRLHAAQRGRPHQDRHVPRPLQLFEAVQGPARRRAAAGRAGGQGGGRRSRVQEPARSRDRRDRRHVPDLARREGAQGDDRAVPAHARAAAARAHRARAVWLRAQSREARRRRRSPCSRR